MEILPHFWISYYRENLIIIKHKKIKNIIHLSKDESYVKKYDIEEPVKLFHVFLIAI